MAFSSIFGRKPIIASLSAFLLGATIAGAASLARGRPHSHVQVREIAVLSHARQERFPVVVMGDSIVEFADLPNLCGQRVLNAGLAGAKVKDLLAFAPQLLSIDRPDLVVIAVGVNDAQAGGKTDLLTFREEYAALVKRVRQVAPAVVILNVAPVARPSFVDARTFDPAAIANINRTLTTLGVPVIDLSDAMARPGAPLPSAYTDDGVHPNATGYIRWREAIGGACALLQSQPLTRDQPS